MTSRSTPTRQWFQPGEGIAREVITADIQRYLGPDALVKPGIGSGEYEQMVQDLKLDSQRWRAEVQQGRGSPLARDSKMMAKPPDKAAVAYQDSRTHQSRQYYGPMPMEEETTPMPSPSQDMPSKEPTMCPPLDMDKAK
ncbi:hypothetical protein SLS56_004907 [Neofusicoccum ribis]|uniref:Uncharacterized protein n=1 Tax=Neofusicoccum ribis TaxID=45134 RepID=A0ABR3SVW7_9PEZI